MPKIQATTAEEREAAREARDTAHRIANYRSDPFKVNETAAEKPYNCYGCSWERLPNNKGFRLKFKHTLCYPNHVRNEGS